jgi:hypothetical protein
MKTSKACRYGLLVLLVALAAPYSAEAANRRPLNRSIYVPVELRVCEHLQNAVLYQGGQAVAVLPAKRVFQFTYYPELKRMEPQIVQLRIEGVYRDTGEPFVAKLAVTSKGIHTAHRAVTLDASKTMQRLRYKIDTRSHVVSLLVRCDKVCSRSNGTRVYVADDSSSAVPNN